MLLRFKRKENKNFFFLHTDIRTNDYFLGCYADFYNPRDISSNQITYPGMTIEYCIVLCFKIGYTVAGLQDRL